MSSGFGTTPVEKALVDQWLLEFAPAEAKRADPLMGWAGSGDTQVQVQLKFPTLAAAQAYAVATGEIWSPWRGSVRGGTSAAQLDAQAALRAIEDRSPGAGGASAQSLARST